jgi:hypothetical protein
MTAQRKAKAHALLANQKAARNNEPNIDVDTYTVSISQILVWYTDNTTDKQRLKYALEYFAKLNKKAEVFAINKASDSELRILGILCRLDSRDQPLSPEHKAKILSEAAILVAKYPVKKEKKVDDKPTNVINIQERIEEKARSLAGEIEGAIDDFVLNKSSDFSAKSYLLSKEVSAPIAKRIGEFYIKLYNELADAINEEDEQLVEGYSNFNKRQLKAFHKFVGQIIEDCEQMVQTAKASRAPRKRKATPPSKVVSKMKYLKEYTELGLKSCKPEDILTASELWVYNTKYRKVQVYRAENGTLGVKGTTVIGFSIKESTSLTLRKPEEFFKGLSIGKRALNAALKKLTTKPTTPNGRINQECVLLGAF